MKYLIISLLFINCAAQYQASDLPLTKNDKLSQRIRAHAYSGVCGNVTATWNANTEDDLAGYKIYYGNSSGDYHSIEDVGNDTLTVVGSLNIGQEYFFAITAYDESGNESNPSEEKSIVISAPGLPDSLQRYDILNNERITGGDVTEWYLRWELNDKDSVLDVNRNGRVTGADVVELKRYIVEH